MLLTSPNPAIFNIARGSLHDGPGIRTVIYFKGCSMNCEWCHNPEGMDPLPQIAQSESKCVKCGRCVSICPGHHKISDGGEVKYIRDMCEKCGRCAAACPNGALEMCGKKETAETLMAEIRKDSHYYAVSGGGATFSGGECLLYPQFLRELLKGCREENIHTVIETALNVPWGNIEAILPFADAFLADIKHMDPKTHKKYTGAGNALILGNLKKLSDLSPGAFEVTARVPLIPSVNDSRGNLLETAEFAHRQKNIKRLELLKYNPMAKGKYERLGKQCANFGDDAQTDAQMDDICETINRFLGAENFAAYKK